MATATLDFPNNWGLGSSSTLLCTMAQWAGIDAFDLSSQTFGGSGYDIACGLADTPIFYQLKKGKPTVTPALFNPIFKKNIYFVHLNKKQNSREGIARYRAKAQSGAIDISLFNDLTERICIADSLQDFENLLRVHEEKISHIVELPQVKDLYFTDYWGEVKSLGAWGGDFVLATSDKSEEATKDYFLKKGFPTVLSFEDMF